MVSSTLIKLSSPFARSCLVALSVVLSIDAILTIYAAFQYPYLVDSHFDDLYIDSSRTLTVVYSGIGLAAILISVSTAFASYKNATNYALIHSGITGVFLPISILVYFTTLSLRYKVNDYGESLHWMIKDYKVSGSHRRKILQPNESKLKPILEPTDSMTKNSSFKLNNLVNFIDSIQTKFTCCGVDSILDWAEQCKGYIPASCCKERMVSTNEEWAEHFNVSSDHEFKFCKEADSHPLGCLVALKEDEQGKHAWLADLIVFMIVTTIANTIVSLLLFGISKTEDSAYESNDCELSIVGASAKPRLSQPTITSIKHRPSVVQTLGPGIDSLGPRAQAVRFNISNSPRASVSGGLSKFSAAARRGSSFI